MEDDDHRGSREVWGILAINTAGETFVLYKATTQTLLYQQNKGAAPLMSVIIKAFSHRGSLVSGTSLSSGRRSLRNWLKPWILKPFFSSSSSSAVRGSKLHIALCSGRDNVCQSAYIMIPLALLNIFHGYSSGVYVVTKLVGIASLISLINTISDKVRQEKYREIGEGKCPTVALGSHAFPSRIVWE